jgi:sarcosine oxidase subunit beta
MKILHETDVLVIGAGIVGCSIAYSLAKRGVSVTVVDGRSIGEGTSSATMALIWVQGKEPAPYMELNLLGAQLHAELATGFDEDVELRQPGGLILCQEEDEFQERLAAMERLKRGSSQYQAQPLSAAEVRELEPVVSSDIAGGIYSPHDGHINPFKYMSTVVRMSKRGGAAFLLHTPVLRILRNEGGVTGAETAQGTIRANQVVVAAGGAAPDLVRSLGVDIRLNQVRGQLLVTARTKPIFSHPLHNQRQTESGNILIGSTHESVGMDTSTTWDAAREIARRVVRLIPALADLSVIRQFSGVRPMPVDGLPFLGPVQRIPGLYISVSHSGITLAPVHGKVISDLIVDGETDVPIAQYRPDRFPGIARSAGSEN